MIEAGRSLDPGREVLVESVTFRGHPLVRSLHPTTIEVTTEEFLTEKGDCIVGVGAAKGCAGLDERIKEILRRRESMVTLRLVVGALSFAVTASGDPRLQLSHEHDMVIRRSDFISDRTLAIRADAAAKDIPRKMVNLLRNPKTVGRLEIKVA
ncbi:MAG: DUF371 domain-containing protein [Thaumarchaeota archaeon]|nr:DUF371 domain-containing protein [Nitrososphaerota archaeon]